MFGFGCLKALKRVKELEERFEKLEHRLVQTDLDWDELYDKCRHLMGRVAKRDSLQAPTIHSKQEDATGATETGGNGRVLIGGRLLTERQREVQQQILRRRGGG